jgi:hypothetical protein
VSMGVGNHLDLLFRQEPLNFLSGVYQGVVPIEHPLSGLQIRLFQGRALRKHLLVSKGFDDVVSVDSAIPGNVIPVGNLLAIAECENHLFREACSNLGLNWAWCSLF